MRRLFSMLSSLRAQRRDIVGTCVRAGAALLLTAIVLPAFAQSAANGKVLYSAIPGSAFACGTSGCHDGFPTTKKNKIANGANNPSKILSAISNGTGGMSVLSGLVSAAQAADIAAYIANPTTTSAPIATLSAATLTFSAQAPGTSSAAQSVTLTNTGTAALSISALSVTGTNATEFTRGGTCAVGSVAAGGNCTVTAIFSPTTAGTKSANITISHNASPATSTIALAGTASGPTVTLSASSLSFATAVVGTAAPALTLTVSNTGMSALNFTALTTGGTNAADFVKSGGTCAVGTPVATAGNCTIIYTFTPAAVGARAGTLTIASNNTSGNVVVNLAGTGVSNTPTAAVSPASVNFTNVQVGTTSAASTVTLTNTSGGTLSVSAVASSNPAVFSVAGCVGSNLAFNQTCALTLNFIPAAAGAASGTISITHNATSPTTFTVSGNGSAGPVPVVRATPNPVTFAGTTTAGQLSAPVRVTFANTGPGAATLASIPVTGPFVANVTGAGACAANASIAVNASCWVDVVFQPAVAGAATGTLTFNNSGQPGILAVPLAGSGAAVAAAKPVLTPVTLDFGTWTVGSASTMQPIMLKNTGGTALAYTGVTVSAPFALIAGPTPCNDKAGGSLLPNESCGLYVTFNPTAAGSATGQVVVLNGTTQLVQATLTGQGAAAGTIGASSTTAAGSSNVGAGAIELPLALLLLLLLVAQWRRSGAPVRAPARRQSY
jgi:hypothetical protein